MVFYLFLFQITAHFVFGRNINLVKEEKISALTQSDTFWKMKGQVNGID